MITQELDHAQNNYLELQKRVDNLKNLFEKSYNVEGTRTCPQLVPIIVEALLYHRLTN